MQDRAGVWVQVADVKDLEEGEREMTKAWLHFMGKVRVWEFAWEHEAQAFCHTTRRGNEYRIIFEPPFAFKPIWIGRVSPGGKHLYTVERQLRASDIEFENGGRWVFPK